MIGIQEHHTLNKFLNGAFVLLLFLNCITISMEPSIHHIFSYGFIVVVFASGLFSWYQNPNSIRFSKAEKTVFGALLVLVLWGFVSAYFSDYKPEALISNMRFFVFTLVVFLINIRFKANQQLLSIVPLTMVLVGITAAFAILFQLINTGNLFDAKGVVRFNGLTGEPNLSGYIIAFSTGFTLLYIKNKWSWLALIVLLGGLLLTYSRAAWLMTAVLLVAYVVFVNKKLFINKYTLFLGVVVLAFGLVFKDQASIILRLENGLITHRNHIWIGAINVIKAHPITGLGTGCLKYEMANYITTVEKGTEVWDIISFGFSQAHNMLLNVGAELGLVGMIITIALIYFIVQSLFFSQKNFNAVLSSIFIAYFVRSLFESNGFVPDGWVGNDIYLWIVIHFNFHLNPKKQSV